MALTQKKVKASRLRDIFDKAVQWGGTISLSAIASPLIVGVSKSWEELLVNTTITLSITKLASTMTGTFRSQNDYGSELPKDHPVNAAINKYWKSFNIKNKPKALHEDPNKTTLNFGASKKDVLISGSLLPETSKKEIESSVAHELGHIEKKDLNKTAANKVLLYAIFLQASFQCLTATSVNSLNIAFISTALSWFIYAQSSQAKERTVDRRALEATGHPFIDSHKDNPYEELFEGKLIERLFSIHPPKEDREKHIDKMREILIHKYPDLFSQDRETLDL